MGSETPPDAYKIALQFNRLYLLMAFWPDPTAQIIPTPFHFLVWGDGHNTRLNWKGMIPKEAPVHPLYRFATELALFHPPRIVIPA